MFFFITIFLKSKCKRFKNNSTTTTSTPASLH